MLPFCHPVQTWTERSGLGYILSLLHSPSEWQPRNAPRQCHGRRHFITSHTTRRTYALHWPEMETPFLLFHLVTLDTLTVKSYTILSGNFGSHTESQLSSLFLPQFHSFEFAVTQNML